MINDDWPVIELCPPKQGILAKFTNNAGENVANFLIKEIVERVDRPSSLDVDVFSNDQELEWIMQVINHGLTLSFSSNQCYDTLRSAVRVYLAWSSALTKIPHESCPRPILMHPDRYFRKILEALRHVFLHKCSITSNDYAISMNRQGTQIITILTAINQLTNKVLNDYKDETWSRSLIFLINITEQLISIDNCLSKESIGCLMANDLCQNLFECWIKAALNECIPSPSYWRTFSALCWRCVSHAQFIESWGSFLLRCTVILLHYLYDNQTVGNIQLDANGIFESYFYQTTTSIDKLQILKNVWLNLFNLIGNPAQLIKHAIRLLESKMLDPINQKYFFDQITLSFFIGIFALKKMIDIFYGDPYISVDFYESEELHNQWLDTTSSLKSLSTNVGTQQIDVHKDRYSNMSSLSNNHYPDMEITRKSMVDIETSENFKKEITVVKFTGKVQAGQHVWYMLKNNPFKRLMTKQQIVIRPSSTSLLGLFLDLLSDSALFKISTMTEDAHSQKSADNVSSLLDSTNVIAEKQQQVEAVSDEQLEQQRESAPYRRSIAASTIGSNSSGHPELTIMFGDHQQQYTSATEFPSVDGISSSRATAIGALCRIVCSKSSREFFSDEQLARFFAILHETLLSRDRLVLCSIIFQTSDNLFKLALKGVQIILPNFLMAIDLIHTESMKIPLHPSISPVEMRAACLRALASILSWPSIFGSNYILDRKFPVGRKVKKQLTRQGSSNNMLEPDLCYNDLRCRMQHILVHSLRNETDPTNIQHTLALSAIFCIESANYDLKRSNFDLIIKEEELQQENEECGIEQHEGLFSISLVRAIISAICDNLCKPIWTNEFVCCLAAVDCLNCLSSISHKVLFYKGEISTGSLIVTSLCRFIDQQLQKPPPHHSKDMHSTVVTAYVCVRTWLNSASALLNIESCLQTVAQTIELGMNGAHNLTPEQYKPASQRVHDAAEILLHSIFSKSECNATITARVNELLLAQKFGLQLDKFQHFLIHNSSLLSLHEAQHIFPLSKGFPTVIAIFRTPFYKPWASVIQLMPKASAREKTKKKVETIQTLPNLPSDQSPGCGNSITSQMDVEFDDIAKNNSPLDSQLDSNNDFPKQFEIPAEVLQPKCKLDLLFPKLETVPPQVTQVQTQLQQFRARLDKGAGAPFGERDSRNVWLNTSLGTILTQPPTPQCPVSHCNSLRVFLYDMGIVNRQAYGKEFTPLDNSSFDIFYDSLAVTVDQINVYLDETVSMFYVKEGQRTAEDILQNNHNLRQTSAQFCRLLSELGKAVETRPISSSQSATTNKTTSENGFVLDGVDYCLRWRNTQVEISFITPTGRTLYSAHIHQHYNNMESARRSSMLDTQQQQQQIVARKSNHNIVTNARANKNEQLFVDTATNNASCTEKALNLLVEQQIDGSDCATTNGIANNNDAMLNDLNKKRAMLIWAQSVDEINEMKEEWSKTNQDEMKEADNESSTEIASIQTTTMTTTTTLTCTTTILTIPTTHIEDTSTVDRPAMPMMMATNVIVKSARFSPLRKENILSSTSQCSTESDAQINFTRGSDQIQDTNQEKGKQSMSEMGRPRLSNINLIQQQSYKRTSQINLKRIDLALTNPDQNTNFEQTTQCNQDTNNMILSPTVSSCTSGGRRRSSFIEMLIGFSPNNDSDDVAKRRGSKHDVVKKDSKDMEADLVKTSTDEVPNNKQAYSQPIIESDKGNMQQQTRASGMEHIPLQHTNSVTTISYLKSFFRRTSKAANNVAPIQQGAPSGRHKSRGEIGEVYEDNMARARSSSTRNFSSHRESLVSNISGVTLNSKAKTSDQGTEKSPILNESDQQPKFQSIKSIRTMSCASASDSISNAEHTGVKSYAKRSSDLRIFVVWFERFEDMDLFPLLDILPFTTFRANSTHQQNQSYQNIKSTMQIPTGHIDHIVFYLYQFERGIVRVQLDGVWTKYGQPGPLLNGSVVSTECLATLLRQTVCNIARRRTIEVENYQMAHSRRKQAITEFAHRFAARQDYTDFVEQFISNSAATATAAASPSPPPPPQIVTFT